MSSDRAQQIGSHVQSSLPVSDDAIRAELVALAREDPGRGLAQFRCLASADQYRSLHRWVLRRVPPGGHVLDWGAGNGHFSYFLLRAGFQATGFALEAAPVKDWLADGSYRFVVAEAREPTRLPFADRSFDAVASVGVLEHVHEQGGDASASLAEIRRVLRPGGFFLCFHFPNRTSWIEALAGLLGAHRHTALFGGRDVQRLVSEAGLELVEHDRYGFLPRNVLGRLPAALGDARGLRATWNLLDAALGALVPVLCQNHRFAARRPQAP